MNQEIMLVKDLPKGSILWKGNSIVGVAGYTIPIKYENNECIKVIGNSLDYEIVKR
jgi:hypothetical protein